MDEETMKRGMRARAAAEDVRAKGPSIGAHMATLNLFREANGEFRITIAEASGFIRAGYARAGAAPIYYVEAAIIDAAELMKCEREKAAG